MTSEPPNTEPPTPHEKRRLSTERRLRAALDRLVGGTPSHPSFRARTYRLSVAVLAREAGVGRNTIYTNHRAILDELSRVDRQIATPKRPASAQKTAELGALIEQLQQQKRQLATENAALLKRALDGEKLVDRLKKQNEKLARELTATREPVVLPRHRT
jgi:hypothetical protein